ncbi:MAG: NADH-quinone oxidoreductase subunit H [Candidatus Riesia sp.]|nr:NADH-quinone oxidoreductase subunit H [Candidatus Riesia sp.]
MCFLIKLVKFTKNYISVLFIFLVIKICILCLVAIGIRGTLPRYRIDQITQYN